MRWGERERERGGGREGGGEGEGEGDGEGERERSDEIVPGIFRGQSSSIPKSTLNPLKSHRIARGNRTRQSHTRTHAPTHTRMHASKPVALLLAHAHYCAAPPLNSRHPREIRQALGLSVAVVPHLPPRALLSLAPGADGVFDPPLRLSFFGVLANVGLPFSLLLLPSPSNGVMEDVLPLAGVVCGGGGASCW